MERKMVSPQNPVVYKWCAILINCFAVFVAYTKAWITIPESVVDTLNIGNGLISNFFDLSDYLSAELSEVKDALLQGKLTLLQTHKGLSALLELFGEDEVSKSDELAVKIFYFLIVAFLIMEAVEILWYFLDRRRAFWGSMISGTALFGTVFWSVRWINQKFREEDMEFGNGLGLSGWAWICFMLPFVSSFLWYQYKKYAGEKVIHAGMNGTSVTHEEYSSMQPGQTVNRTASAGNNGAFFGFSVDGWKAYFEKNKIVVIFTVVAAFFPKLADWTGLSQGSLWSLMNIVAFLAEGVAISLAIIYGRARRYEYLILYGILFAIGKRMVYAYSVDYYSGKQQLGYIWYPLLMAAVIYLCERYLQENKNKWYIMIGVAAAVRVLVVVWLQLDLLSLSLVIDLNTIVLLGGMAATMYIYLYKKELFKKITMSTDEQL